MEACRCYRAGFPNTARPLTLPLGPRAAANDTFDARPVPTLPPTKLPLDFTPEKVPILLTDTSAKPEDARALDAVVRESDAVVVCFDPKKPSTLESVRTVWYPRVQALNTDIPIILACCKADRLSDRDSPSIREVRRNRREGWCGGSRGRGRGQRCFYRRAYEAAREGCVEGRGLGRGEVLLVG